jgi:hypothetical protein
MESWVESFMDGKTNTGWAIRLILILLWCTKGQIYLIKHEWNCSADISVGFLEKIIHVNAKIKNKAGNWFKLLWGMGMGRKSCFSVHAIFLLQIQKKGQSKSSGCLVIQVEVKGIKGKMKWWFQIRWRVMSFAKSIEFHDLLFNGQVEMTRKKVLVWVCELLNPF